MAQRYKQRLLASSGYSNKKVESQYGEKMLKMMGWTEGKGLGKTQDGISECVQQRRRQQGQGLGVADKKNFKWNDNWWDNIYSSAMKKFKYVKKQTKKDKQQSTSSSSDSNSDDSSSCSSSESDNSVAKFHKNKRNKQQSVKTKKIHKVVIIKREKKVVKKQESEDEE